jgi:hypothetical protein
LLARTVPPQLSSSISSAIRINSSSSEARSAAGRLSVVRPAEARSRAIFPVLPLPARKWLFFFFAFFGLTVMTLLYIRFRHDDVFRKEHFVKSPGTPFKACLSEVE